jgi:hypothetical protein
MRGITEQQKKNPCDKQKTHFVARLLVPNHRQREEDALFGDVKDLQSFLLVPKKRRGEEKRVIEKEDPPHSDGSDQCLIKKKVRDTFFEEVKDPVKSFLLVPKKRRDEKRSNIQTEDSPPSINDQHLIKNKKEALLKEVKDLQEEKDNLFKSLYNEKNNEEIVTLKDEVAYLKDKNHDLNFNIDLKNKEIAEKNVEIDKLKTTIHGLERCDLESVRHIEELETTRKNLEILAVELEAQATELQTWGDDLQTKNFEWHSYSSNLQQKLVEATKRFASIEGGVSQVILTLLSTMHVNGMDVGLGGVVREADRLIQTVSAKNGFKRGFHLDVERGIVDVEVHRAKRQRIVEEGLDEDRFYENHASDLGDDQKESCDLGDDQKDDCDLGDDQKDFDFGDDQKEDCDLGDDQKEDCDLGGFKEISLEEMSGYIYEM